MIKNIYILFSIGAMLLSSCGEFEEDLNTNPNQPSLGYTNGLITYGIRRIALRDNLNRLALLYTQQLSEITYTNASRYITQRSNYSSAYIELASIQKIIDLNTDAESKSLPNVLKGGSNDYQIAVAKILKSYGFLRLTDRFGAIPYYEALQGDSKEKPILNPRFDKQEDVYTGIFNELKEAITLLDKDDITIAGDILFDGDKAKWKAFANSIIAIAALRLSDVKEATA